MKNCRKKDNSNSWRKKLISGEEDNPATKVKLVKINKPSNNWVRTYQCGQVIFSEIAVQKVPKSVKKSNQKFLRLGKRVQEEITEELEMIQISPKTSVSLIPSSRNISQINLINLLHSTKTISRLMISRTLLLRDPHRSWNKTSTKQNPENTKINNHQLKQHPHKKSKKHRKFWNRITIKKKSIHHRQNFWML